MAEDKAPEPEKLPYKLSSLQWDSAHHFNTQNRYGYTGRGRKLGDPMLQCEMCMQWFHAKDVSCLKPEDGFVAFQRNYRFICRICAGGTEQLEFLTNTWSSVVLSALYNLLLSEHGESLGESQRSVAVGDLHQWISSHWGSLTQGRNLQQLQENKALEKCLHSSVNANLWTVSDDRNEVSLRSLLPAKLHLKPFTTTTVSASAVPNSKPKRERETAAPGSKRKKGDKVKQGGTRLPPPSTAPSAQEIKLPEKYRLLPAPRVEQQPSAQDASLVLLSRSARAPQIVLRENSLTAVGCKGYRTVRATHGVRSGAWYFEVKVEESLGGEEGHTRLGWSTEMGELQAPVGYDANSYAYRDLKGSKFHESIGSTYGEAYGPGDVIGCELVMGDPAAHVRQQQRINIKGVEYIVEEERERTASVGSSISFFKNGVCQGVAFSDIWAEVYYPAASLYKSAVVSFNFGPDFAFPPTGREARPVSELATPVESKGEVECAECAGETEGASEGEAGADGADDGEGASEGVAASEGLGESEGAAQGGALFDGPAVALEALNDSAVTGEDKTPQLFESDCEAEQALEQAKSAPNAKE